MNPEELRAWLTKIEKLIARADVAKTPNKREEYLEEALAEICAYVRELLKRMPNVIDRLLERGRFADDQIGLPLGDIAATDEELEVFRTKETLLQFLAASKGLLKSQMRLTEKEIQAVFRQVELTYDVFITESLAKEPLLEKLQHLLVGYAKHIQTTGELRLREPVPELSV